MNWPHQPKHKPEQPQLILLTQMARQNLHNDSKWPLWDVSLCEIILDYPFDPICTCMLVPLFGPFADDEKRWKTTTPLFQRSTSPKDLTLAPNNFIFGDASEISDLFAGKPMVKHVKPMVNQPTLPASCPKIEVNGWYATGSCPSDETCRGIKCRVAGTQARFDPRGWEIPAPNGGLKGFFSWKDIRTGWWFGTFGLFFHIYRGISSSQLTNSMNFQRGRAQPPTREHPPFLELWLGKLPIHNAILIRKNDRRHHLSVLFSQSPSIGKVK